MLLCAYNPKEDSIENLLDRFYQTNLTQKLRKLYLLQDFTPEDATAENNNSKYYSDEEILVSLV